MLPTGIRLARPPPPLPFLSLTTAATTTNSPSYIHLHFHFHPRHRPFAPQRYAEAYFPSTSSRAFSSRTPAEMDSQSRPSTSIAACRELAGRPGARILALCGAGLSAASGLPTFRGAGGLWRNHDPTSLATPDAFAADPGLVWLFYAWRRHMALRARPNRAHYALAALAKANPDFLCLSQNVDGLSPRAGHPASQLRLLHGSILDVKCFNGCGYVDRDNLSDPLCPALAAAAEDYPADQTMPLLDPDVPVPAVRVEDLPHCPRCRNGLLRPGVVWFGEPLDDLMMMEVENWIWRGQIDLMIVVGTAAAVYPAAAYTRKAQRKGARVAVVNPDPDSAAGLSGRDFFFQGDAAEILPQLFEGAIGKMDADGQIVEEPTAASPAS